MESRFILVWTAVNSRWHRGLWAVHMSPVLGLWAGRAYTIILGVLLLSPTLNLKRNEYRMKDKKNNSFLHCLHCFIACVQPNSKLLSAARRLWWKQRNETENFPVNSLLHDHETIVPSRDWTRFRFIYQGQLRLETIVQFFVISQMQANSGTGPIQV